ncbi:MAG: redoxin domain-containing protein [Planctomycetota bacterium]|nr:redoxin domain-containing protein [Planctomycetota bacterium]MDA1166020.1 redoxin domain-containing protein [Planctomycetota bacterium]
MKAFLFSVVIVMLSVVMLRAEEKASDKNAAAKAEKVLKIGSQAPDFEIKDSNGKLIKLSELTKKGPVLVRLTCGCSGCDRELAYFQTLHKAYEGKGLTSLAIFREPDNKVEAYVKEKKLKMLYAVDTKGESWKAFDTKAMPSNFLIEKGGKVRSIAVGCDPSGLLANNVSKFVAQLLETEKVDVQKATNEAKKSSEKKVAK